MLGSKVHLGAHPRSAQLVSLRTQTRRAVPAALAVASQNGTAQAAAKAPSPAETARTVVDICQEGILSTIGADGTPIGTPVAFSLDKAGHPQISLVPGSVELKNLEKNARCSLQVQPIAMPARAVASVTLLGQWQQSEASHTLAVDRVLYFGGLDQGQAAAEVSGEEFRSAEPDVLRKVATELVRCWNEERAEDIYRIVADHLSIPLTEMGYAELLWVDRLGMYVRVEAEGHIAGLKVVRVPFPRAVMDDRDARSVLTMAAQVAWEKDRPYVPPVPSIFTDAAAATNN